MPDPNEHLIRRLRQAAVLYDQLDSFAEHCRTRTPGARTTRADPSMPPANLDVIAARLELEQGLRQWAARARGVTEQPRS